MTTRHVLLSEGRVVHVDGANRPDAHVGSPAGPALLALAAEDTSGTVTWRDQHADDLLRDPQGWPSLLTGPHQVRSAGFLHRDDPWRTSLGAADFDSALQLPAPDDRAFGTWLLSPLAGVAAASALHAAGAPPGDLAFEPWLLCLGHRAHLAGALLWSEPALVRPGRRQHRAASLDAAATATVVRHAHGRRFLPPWVLSRSGAEQTWSAGAAAVRASMRADRTRPPRPVSWPSPTPLPDPAPGVDVVIPTLGRRALLLDVLDDLGRQTLLPRHVVVVEQTGGSPVGLPLEPNRWPFSFEHVVIEPLGAGNARNEGIVRGEAEWVLLLDDDERFAPDMLERLWGRVQASHADVITARLDRADAEEPSGGPTVSMWPGFGSGCALLHRSLLEEVGGFDRRLDGGFGEDTELGVRLRRAGAMVVLATDPPVTHLKATTGGMRAPFPHPWRSDPVRPRPSPTVLLARRTFETPAMAAGYRVHWWLDGLRNDGFGFRPLRRWRQWRSAQRWTDHLEDQQPSAESRRLSTAEATPLGAERHPRG